MARVGVPRDYHDEADGTDPLLSLVKAASKSTGIGHQVASTVEQAPDNVWCIRPGSFVLDHGSCATRQRLPESNLNEPFVDRRQLDRSLAVVDCFGGPFLANTLWDKVQNNLIDL